MQLRRATLHHFGHIAKVAWFPAAPSETIDTTVVGRVRFLRTKSAKVAWADSVNTILKSDTFDRVFASNLDWLPDRQLPEFLADKLFLRNHAADSNTTWQTPQ